MRTVLCGCLTASLLLLANTAHAGVLTSATWVGSFQGTPFTLVTSGASLNASGTATGTSASVALTVLAPRLTTITTVALPVLVSQTLGGSQTLAIGAGVAANHGVPGAQNAGLVSVDGGVFNLFPIALSVGGSGAFQTAVVLPGGALNLAITAAATFHPWTTGSVTLTSLFGITTTPQGRKNSVPLPDLVTAGTNHLSAGVGSVTLVSPTVISVCTGRGFQPPPCIPTDTGNFRPFTRTASPTRLTLNFVPETDPTMLLATGLMILAAAVRKH